MCIELGIECHLDDLTHHLDFIECYLDYLHRSSCVLLGLRRVLLE